MAGKRPKADIRLECLKRAANDPKGSLVVLARIRIETILTDIRRYVLVGIDLITAQAQCLGRTSFLGLLE